MRSALRFEPVTEAGGDKVLEIRGERKTSVDLLGKSENVPDRACWSSATCDESRFSMLPLGRCGAGKRSSVSVGRRRSRTDGLCSGDSWSTRPSAFVCCSDKSPRDFEATESKDGLRERPPSMINGIEMVDSFRAREAWSRLKSKSSNVLAGAARPAPVEVLASGGKGA